MPSLQHVFFFLDANGASAPTNRTLHMHPSPTWKHGDSAASADSSVRSSPTSATSRLDVASASRSSTPLTPTAPSFEPLPAFNPCAQAFVPTCTPVEPTLRRVDDAPWFEMRLSPGKGHGLFATRQIPVGTRIIKERPLVAINPADLTDAHRKYLLLSPHDRMTYDSLCCYCPPDIDFEHAASVYLLHPKYSNLSPEATAMLKEDVIRVMGIFAANNFIMDDGSQGVFPTASRLNHSCVPNVHHTNNPNIRRETVQAMRDIQPGEELFANYLGAAATHQPREVRMQPLSINHGFICQCQACLDPNSDRRRFEINGVFWGLNEYMDGSSAHHIFVPKHPLSALAQAEHGISLLIEEGIFNTELCKAYRVAATLALDINDYDKALEYSENELEVEFNLNGHEVGDLVEKGIAAKQWVEKVRLLSAEFEKSHRKKTKNTKKKARTAAKCAAMASSAVSQGV